MNYRQISTKIWRDEKFVALSESAQRLVLYLITNHLIGLIPAYKISKRELMFDLGFTTDRADKYIKEIESVGIYILEEYCVFNNDFANYLITGGKTDEERQRQINNLPKNIKDWVNSNITIDQLLGNDCSTIETITPISNIKPINKYNTIDSVDEELMKKLAEHYNVRLIDVKKTYDAMYLWAKSKGKVYKDYRAGLMNWIARRLEEGKIKSL